MNWNYPLGSTEYFFILFFIAVYVAYLIRTFRVARQLNTRTRVLIIKAVLRTVAFSLLIVSLLGPSFGEAEKQVEAQGKDIYLVVDLSASMNAADVMPSRLEKVKFELNRMMEDETGNRMGIIVFANDAFVQVPLTYDRDALKQFVQSLQTDLMPASGTNLCGATDLAFNKLVGAQAPDERAKMIVIFTDGENNENCDNRLFNNLRRYGIGVYVVGVGTKSGASIKEKNEILRDEKGNVVVTRLDEELLTGFVTYSKGIFYHLNNQKNEMNRLLSDVRNARSSVINARTMMVDSDKYYYFLGAALLLIVMDVLITIGTFRL